MMEYCEEIETLASNGLRVAYTAARPWETEAWKPPYGIKAHVESDQKDRNVILLIHGFPQTPYQFRKVIHKLAAATGSLVIAPSYRGAGSSCKPLGGPSDYTKFKMASDFKELLHQLGLGDFPLHVVGHDIGGMITVAYAMQFPCKSVIWGECPLPGSTAYEENKWTPPLFHFSFHSTPDLPELLTAGRERQYIKVCAPPYTRLPVNQLKKKTNSNFKKSCKKNKKKTPVRMSIFTQTSLVKRVLCGRALTSIEVSNKMPKTIAPILICIVSSAHHV